MLCLLETCLTMRLLFFRIFFFASSTCYLYMISWSDFQCASLFTVTVCFITFMVWYLACTSYCINHSVVLCSLSFPSVSFCIMLLSFITSFKYPLQLKNLMVVGIDSYHDSSKKGRSVGGVIASMNQALTRYYSRCTFQHSMQELMDGLKVCMKGLNASIYLS